MKNNMTWGDLLEVINNEEFQAINKNKQIYVWYGDEEKAKTDVGVTILKEDNINPENYGMDGISAYQDEIDEDADFLKKYPVVAVKGEAFLTIGWNEMLEIPKKQ